MEEEEKASKEEIIESLKEALNRTGIIIETPYYVFALYEVGDDLWKQVQYVFEDSEGFIEKTNTKRALMYLIEEVGKSLITLNKGDWRVVLNENELEEVLNRIRE